MPWKRASLWPVLQRLWWAACLALAAFLLTLAFVGWHVLPAFGFACALWLIGGAAADIADRAGLGRTRLANVLNRARALPRSAWGAAIAHAGVGVMLLGISGMGLSTEHIAALPPGGSTQFARLRVAAGRRARRDRPELHRPPRHDHAAGDGQCSGSWSPRAASSRRAAPPPPRPPSTPT